MTFQGLAEGLKGIFPSWKIVFYETKRGHRYIQIMKENMVILINYGVK